MALCFFFFFFANDIVDRGPCSVTILLTDELEIEGFPEYLDYYFYPREGLRVERDFH